MCIRLCAGCLVYSYIKKKLTCDYGPCPHGTYVSFQIKRLIFPTCNFTSKEIIIKYEGIEVHLKLFLLYQ